MHRISSTIRITIGLACLAVTILLFAQTVGFVPNREAAVIEGRTMLAETVAIHCSTLASRSDIRSMQTGLEVMLRRYPDMVYAAVRPRHGAPAIELGDRPILGDDPSDTSSSDALMTVPIMAGGGPWGDVEIGFRALRRRGIGSFWSNDVIRLSIFVAICSCLVYFLYLRKLLQDLDPSRVIPERVRTTLDTFAEGLLVLDQKERIVLANQAFSMTVGKSPSALQGRRIADLPWAQRDQDNRTSSYPWQQAMGQNRPQIGDMLEFQRRGASSRTFMVNSSPIVGDDGKARGALVSFDDVTVMERKRVELRETLEMLKRSRDEIHRKNLELQEMAAHDPLTSCLNRRSFFEQFETDWSNAERYGHPLAFVMVDIDHFKQINDNHGHSVGDDVLQKVAAVLRATARQGDVVCRYGGEEFGILLPHLDIDEACQAAERYRRAISEMVFANISVTASFGVSATHLGATSFNELIDQADKCLYVAKQEGRNQVCSWDKVPQEMDIAQPEPSPPKDGDVAIPFHAVTALISALSYRDTGSAEHSRRVADLCAAMAGLRLSAGEAYVTETAALLHDIGKIGVPDSILLKPGPLTDEEWQVMRAHDRIGGEIVKSSFACQGLNEIIENHHAWFGGNPRNPELPTGHDIPLGARILTIADAFDAMVSDRVYRAGRSTEEAFVELRRCAGTQFDPELVEAFIECVLARDDSRRAEGLSVSKQTALRIGLQIESLATAVDSHDYTGLAAQADRLKRTATKYGVPDIADMARQLEQSAKEEANHIQLAELTNDLLNLCRSTQSAYLGSAPQQKTAENTETEESAESELTGAL